MKDRDSHVVFESGALNANGSIEGNDNDADAARFEPHYTEVSNRDQVQIYEDVIIINGGSCERLPARAVECRRCHTRSPSFPPLCSEARPILRRSRELRGFPSRGSSTRSRCDFWASTGGEERCKAIGAMKRSDFIRRD